MKTHETVLISFKRKGRIMSATAFSCVFLAAFSPHRTFASETTLATNTLQCVDGQECSQSPTLVQKHQVYVAKSKGLDHEKEKQKETIENTATKADCRDDPNYIHPVYGGDCSGWKGANCEARPGQMTQYQSNDLKKKCPKACGLCSAPTRRRRARRRWVPPPARRRGPVAVGPKGKPLTGFRS